MRRLDGVMTLTMDQKLLILNNVYLIMKYVYSLQINELFDEMENKIK